MFPKKQKKICWGKYFLYKMFLKKNDPFFLNDKLDFIKI